MSLTRLALDTSVLSYLVVTSTIQDPTQQAKKHETESLLALVPREIEILIPLPALCEVLVAVPRDQMELTLQKLLTVEGVRLLMGSPRVSVVHALLELERKSRPTKSAPRQCCKYDNLIAAYAITDDVDGICTFNVDDFQAVTSLYPRVKVGPPSHFNAGAAQLNLSFAQKSS